MKPISNVRYNHFDNKSCDSFQLSVSYVVLFEKDPLDGKNAKEAVVGYCESMQEDVFE